MTQSQAARSLALLLACTAKRSSPAPAALVGSSLDTAGLLQPGHALWQPAGLHHVGKLPAFATKTYSGSDKAVTVAESLWNAPNMLSLGRGASGPFIAYLIIQEQWPVACAAVAISGATDWLDGYLARRMGLQSVLGSYLDPLGDKILICSVVSALAVKDLIPAWVAAVIVGRDVALVVGTLLHRWHTLGWRRVTIQEFCQTQAAGPSAAPATQSSSSGAVSDRGTPAALAKGEATADQRAPEQGLGSAGAPMMKPLMISKVNTVLQLGLVAGCLGQAWVAWPGADTLHALEVLTAGTTSASCLAYAYQHLTRTS